MCPHPFNPDSSPYDDDGSLVPSVATYRLLPNHPRDRDVDAFNHQLGLLKEELRRCRLENGNASPTPERLLPNGVSLTLIDFGALCRSQPTPRIVGVVWRMFSLLGSWVRSSIGFTSLS